VAILSLEDVHMTYGERHLLGGVSFLVDDRDRVGIVGPNGSGKSTLLRILAGDEEPDLGKRTVRRDLTIGYLAQEPWLDPALSVRDVAREGLAGREQVLERLERVHEALADCAAQQLPTLLGQQSQLEDRLESLGGHDVEYRIESLIGSVGLPDPDAIVGQMSGGEQRRAALARILVSEPNLLLLDEPTNHLDTEVIVWLEDLLRQSRAALVLVTHDRYFLDRVVDRVVELDRAVLHEYAGSYTDFLVARGNRLDREKATEATRRNLLRRETDWIRRSPPARTSKSKSRIQHYDDLVSAAPESVANDLSFQIPCEQRLGERVVNLIGVGKSFDGRVVLQDLDLEIARGERLGIIGPNGAGKTTLLKICTGELGPDVGEVRVGSTVRFSTIDQERSDLHEEKTVIDEVGGDNDYVFVGGRALRIESYLERFLFPSNLLRTLIRDLSGGERNRVLLAKLLAVGGNVLVLDEPTNDLDLMTLRVLEEALCAFGGSALIVSHDRWFLDRVATRVLHLSVDGRYRLHSGDVTGLLDILAGEATAEARARAAARTRPSRVAKVPGEDGLPKLTARERSELAGLPDRIVAIEEQLGDLDARLADPKLYSGDRQEVQELAARRKAAESELGTLYSRWEELEA
jgi:ATP-binding cassette subfamily F protein uup